MIKINLALRKQSGAGASDAGKTGTGAFALPTGVSRMTLDIDQLKDLPIKSMVICLAVSAIAWYLSTTYKEEEMQKLADIQAKVSEERARLEEEIKKYKSFDEVKKSIDQDEFTLRTKIDTIQKLIADRSSPPRLMLSLALSIPKDVWLTELKISETETRFKGYSLGFNQISDFMKGLGESAYFTDLSIKKTEQSKDDLGVEVAAFELAATRR